jgi:hypothetical protein
LLLGRTYVQLLKFKELVSYGRKVFRKDQIT